MTINGEPRHIVGYLQDFLFVPTARAARSACLSGGERNRLLLAKLFTQPANILVMDEPTNDLDIETLDLLENLLVEFKGTLLVVSHDRDFLNNVVTSTIAFEETADGFSIAEYVGGYDDWLRQRRVETASAKPRLGVKPAPKPVAQKPKLSFKEQQELAQIPARIEILETEQQKLAAQLADAAFYQQGGNAAQASARLAALESELGVAFARWNANARVSSQ